MIDTLSPVVVLLMAASFAAGFREARLRYMPAKPQEIPQEPLSVAEEPDQEKPVESFAVARSERRPTWRERRRELEAKARTKRKQLEEWRD